MDGVPGGGTGEEPPKNSLLVGILSSRKASDGKAFRSAQENETIDNSIDQLHEKVIENLEESSSSSHGFRLSRKDRNLDYAANNHCRNLHIIRAERSASDDFSGKIGINTEDNLKRSNSCEIINENRTGDKSKCLHHGSDLLNEAKNLMREGEDPVKALKLVIKARKSFEADEYGKPSLDLIKCLHIMASIYCKIGGMNEAVSVLNQAIKIATAKDSPEHALAKFVGHMLLGDTYSMLGQMENTLRCYGEAMEIQKQVIGDKDPRFGETCRYIAEAYVQALKLDEAERLCKIALDIFRQDQSLQEAETRRLIALIFAEKDDHKTSLEHLLLANSVAINFQTSPELAYIQRSIGDAYRGLGQYNEAISAYEQSLDKLKTFKEENHPVISSVLVRLADVFKQTGKLGKAKSYCEEAVRMNSTLIAGSNSEEIASGYIEVAAVYESMNELAQAIYLLHKALKILYKDELFHRITIAGIEGQIGVIEYTLEDYNESYVYLKKATTKLQEAGKEKSTFYGAALNLMGLICMHSGDLDKAAEHLEEATAILQAERGTQHLDTLAAYGSLAAVYDAKERMDDAMGILEYVVTTKEKLGMVDLEMEEEKKWLQSLRDEVSRIRRKKLQIFCTSFN